MIFMRHVCVDVMLFFKLSQHNKSFFRIDILCKQLSGDKAQIETYCKEMNAGPAFPLLASMITQRSWDDVVSEDIDR